MDNNKLMELFIIAGGSLLLSQEQIKGKRKQKTKKTKKWVSIWKRKTDSKGAYYSIINDLSLTDKAYFRKDLRMNTLASIPILLFYLKKNQNYVFPIFLFLVKMWSFYILSKYFLPCYP